MDDLSKSVESLIDCVFDLMQYDRITATSLESFVGDEHFGSLLPFDETIERILCLMVRYYRAYKCVYVLILWMRTWL